MRLVLSLCLLVLVAGCSDVSEQDEEVAKKKRSPLDPEMIQDIGEFDPNEKQEVSQSKGSYSNPITGALEMYGPMLEKVSKIKIQHAVRLYQAEHGEYPQSYDEFMTRIIKANHIKLPKLPGELKYEYDVQNHKLEVVKKPTE